MGNNTSRYQMEWRGRGDFAAASRMALGTLCMILLLVIRRKRLPSHGKAKRTYFVVAIQIYAAMLAVYWGAKFIPSGWVSVIFGLSPFITALFAAIWLKERSLSFGKLLSYCVGVLGLANMFSSALEINKNAVYGIMGVLIAVCLQTASAVWVKRINAKLPATSQVTGGLLFAMPAYLFTWVIVDNAHLPEQISVINIASILYLGVIATTIGFVLYYYLLIHLSATSVGMIPLITPIIALYLGYSINQEPITSKIILGTLLILTALFIYQFLDRFILMIFKK